MKIIAPEVLEKRLLELDKEALKYKYWVDFDDPLFGKALKFYLLLMEQPYLLDEELSNDQESLFYSRYYWFTYFLKLYTYKNGSDASMEQRAYQLLEESESLRLIGLL